MPAAAFLVSVAVATLAAISVTSPALAHEGRNVGDYNLVVGFLNEPAYEGQLNAVSLVVTRSTPHDSASATDADAPEESDHHDDGHSHSHGDDDNETAPTNHTGEPDVFTHGALFISPSLDREESFEFHVTDEMEGFGIPYHLHPSEEQGLITVSDDVQHQSANKTVVITNEGLDSKRINVGVGDTVAWINRSTNNVVIMSGPLSAMTDAIRREIETSETAGATQSADTANRVAGLASTLRVELMHISTSSSVEMTLTEKFDDPGHYIAEFIPTAPGDYRVRFFGSIEETPIDETFDSGPDTFDTVIPSDAIQFPIVLESNREIRNAAQGALDAVQELETEVNANSSAASTGMIVGAIGILIGGIAIGMSVFAITIARRRN